jgi:glucokinase
MSTVPGPALRGQRRRTGLRILGIDIGGTNIKRVVLDGERVVEESQVPTASEDGPQSVIDRVSSLAQATGEVDAIGIAVPGALDDRGGTLLVANLDGDWAGRPLAEPIQRLLSVPVTVINDGHAFTLAESTLGAGRGAKSVVGVVCGTGIGGGLTLEGRVHDGAAGRAGELGHQTMRPSGRMCGCGNRGCLEAYAGARAIARSAGVATFDRAVEAANEGDPRAIRALDRAGELIGRAIANVLIFLAPDRVVVGGGVIEAAPRLLDSIFAHIVRLAPAAPLEEIALCRAELGVTAGAIGAALRAAARAEQHVAIGAAGALVGGPVNYEWENST